MDIYNYHASTGIFTAQTVARESPLEPGVFLMPANSTEIAPPSPGVNEAARFVGGAWEIVPDFRGTEYWLPDGSNHIIDHINELRPNNALDVPPVIVPAPLTLQERLDDDPVLKAMFDELESMHPGFSAGVKVRLL